MPSGRPADNEYAPFYAGYVSLVPEEDVLLALERQVDEVRALCSAVPKDRERLRYAAGKWSVREVIGHLVDGERVFGYRAFCISRGEQGALPSFDENAYVGASRYDAVSLAEIARELVAVRETNLLALRRLDGDAWTRVGTASGKPVSVRALAYVMVGHVRHHLAILRERYGVA
jgi:hypothetical protein